jgi:rhodanese-related sulfurtransferase
MVKTEGKVLGKDVAVIDVRGDDYAGGHIKGAIHQSSKTLPHGGVEEIREKTKDVPTVIFHCLLSQVRFVFLTYTTCLTSHGREPGDRSPPG